MFGQNKSYAVKLKEEFKSIEIRTSTFKTEAMRYNWLSHRFYEEVCSSAKKDACRGLRKQIFFR